MYVEKNVCESIISTLLNILGKMKDGLNIRLDMVDMGIQEELAPHERGNKHTYLPLACYTLTRQKKKQGFCTTLSEVKVLSGYSFSVSSCTGKNPY